MVDDRRNPAVRVVLSVLGVLMLVLGEVEVDGVV